MQEDNNTETIEDIIEPISQGEDTEQYNLDEVKAYLSENYTQETDQYTEEEDTKEDEVVPEKKDNKLDPIKIEPSKLYENSKYFDMYVPVQDHDHVITLEDKEAYLDAMLQESDLHLTIKMSSGISITCRDLNMYERQLSLELAKKEAVDKKLTPNLAFSILRDIRMPMQIVSINNKKFNTVRFTYDPDSTQDKFEQDMARLKLQSKNIVMPIPSSLQALYLKALNIFEHKLAKLEEAAFNQDFWNPVGRV